MPKVATDKKGQKVKFIRKNGKVIPIKADRYKEQKLDLRTSKTKKLARKTGIYNKKSFQGILSRSTRKTSTKERFKMAGKGALGLGLFAGSVPVIAGALEGSKRLMKGGLVAAGVGAALGAFIGGSTKKIISEKKFSKERKKAIRKGLKGKSSV